MSRRGNCRDNAVVESFIGSLKKERGSRNASTRHAKWLARISSIPSRCSTIENADTASHPDQAADQTLPSTRRSAAHGSRLSQDLSPGSMSRTVMLVLMPVPPPVRSAVHLQSLSLAIYASRGAGRSGGQTARSGSARLAGRTIQYSLQGFWKEADVCGVWSGARGRTRTGTELPPRDFLTATAFAAVPRRTHLWSGLSLCPAADSAG